MGSFLAVMASLFFLFFMLVTFFKAIRIVPQQQAWVVQRLGKFSKVLDAGFHVLIPFVESVQFKHDLREIPLDIPEQICITRDNISIGIDGILYFKVLDPQKATYGVSNYAFALIQIAQTTLRSEIGKMELNETLQERARINQEIVHEVDKASEPWGVKVLRYEIKQITPPRDIIDAMEKRMRAEREKDAQIQISIGDRDSKINRAEGLKQETIKNSEADKQRRINEAEGQAAAIFAVAQATADGIRKIAEAINHPGGREAVQLRVAEEYIKEFGKLAKSTNTMIVPASTSDMSGMIATAMSIFDATKGSNPPPKPSN